MSLLRNPQRSSTITTVPLVALIVGLVCAGVPVFDRITPWAIALFFVACGARLWMNRPGGRLPSLPLKVLLFALSVGGIALTYGTALGVEPGLSILLLLVSLKLLETNTVRDFQVMCLLGYFLALCDLFFSQSLTLWLYVSAVFVLITAALIRFHRGAGPASLRRGTRTVGWLMIQALPLVLILFLFVPRSRQQFLLQFSQPLLGSSGMSDRLSPGSIASLVLNQDVVFRADFPDGNVPSMSQMYWRAGVLWHGDGLTWNRGPQMTPERRVGQLAGPLIRQRIILQPHGARWLYALDRPAASEARDARFMAGGYLQSSGPVLKRMQYDVFSRPENREVVLPADQRTETLRQPTHASPRVLALVRGWRTAHPTDRALVEAALQHFRTERFVYTFEPGTYESADPLGDFLFERRAGFCEHYAAAYATLMRLAGIPSRVVIGYHGGEYNALGKYVIVRQSDAHAWCEVWIKGEGWLRIDPTDVIAPDRLTSGLESFLQTRSAANQPANQTSSAVTGWRDLQRDARLAWDNLNHQWDLRVLGFDEENQRTFLTSFGLGDFKWVDVLVWMVIPSAMVLGLVGLWLRRPGRSPGDPVVHAYARFCQRLAAAGLPREPAEGPHHFGERAAAHFPAAAAQIRAIIALYTALRYSSEPPSPTLLRRALRTLPRRLRSAS
jgi:transglutaminase-like putative cysteine protease